MRDVAGQLSTGWLRGRRASALMVFALTLLSFVGCESDDSSNFSNMQPSGNRPSQDYCTTYLEKIRECDLIGEGRYNEDCTNYEDAAEDCETRCLEDASCDGVQLLFCNSSGTVTRCMNECVGFVPPASFSCNDGSEIDGNWRCDDFADCLDAEDEDGCEFHCRNVAESVDLALVCDGASDCSDGSDEPPDCDTAFLCADGEQTVAAFCDGYEDCTDGSDEPSDCAPNLCP